MTLKKCFYYNFIIALRSRQCEMELNGDRKSHRTMNVSLHISPNPASFKYIKDPESGGFMAGSSLLHKYRKTLRSLVHHKRLDPLSEVFRENRKHFYCTTRWNWMSRALIY